MKQIFSFVALIILSAFVFVGFVPNSASADVNDFSFSSFDADYYLSKDSEGRSTMKVVERVTAEFTNLDQNKGIERAIPKYYDGHSVSFQLQSLTRNGQTEPIYEQKQDGDFEIISTGNDDYLNGTQDYIFTYTLRDVVKNFDNHQELYWDTNGTGSDQTFGSVTAHVFLDDSIKNDFTGATSCYQGPEYSKEKCDVNVEANEITFKSTRVLTRRENLSMNLSFKSGTFTGYKMTFADLMPYGFLIIATLLFVVLVFIKLVFAKDNPGKGIIVPEYLPPKKTSVLMSAEIFDKPKNSITAQIIDLAVRHKIRIEESEKDGFIGKSKQYTLVLLDISGLDQNELSFINTLFTYSTQIGSKYTLKKDDYPMASAMQRQSGSYKKISITNGYRYKNIKVNIIYGIVMLLMVIFVIISMITFINNQNILGGLLGFAFFVVFVFLVPVFKLNSVTPLTASGRELYDYLKGLKMYIKLAEVERLKVLQSVEGSVRKSVDTNDSANMIVLYERVLPYAVLFGQEKSWLDQLGQYYNATQAQPEWYSGMGAFNAIAFASAVGSFSSYAGSNSFSSSSGAGGGGFSGGGGGGGGFGGR